MNRALVQFESNLRSTRQLGIIFQAFHGKVTNAISLDELLRAEIVLAVSALDCYVHDVVRIGMVKSFQRMPGETSAYLNFRVSMQFVERLLQTPLPDEGRSLLDQEVRRLHGYRTFQNADNISQALSLIGVAGMWDEVGIVLGMSSADVRTRLGLVVDRRNKIAHEADIDPSTGIASKYPIDFATVREAVAFLEELVKSMHGVICRQIAF